MFSWNQLMSQTCAILSGVKQLSPILYNVYVDNVIIILRNSKLLCMYSIIMNIWEFVLMQMVSVYHVLWNKRNVTGM